jgi:TetR/AcrR family transcriptional regulator, transcriptional repressor for nem operon
MARASVKEHLLESAVGTFRSHGVRGSSVSVLAADAAVPVGSVYNHFSGKEDLAVQVLRRYAAETDTSMFEGDGRAIDRLREHFERQIARTRGTGIGYGCLLENFAGELSDDAFPRLRDEVRSVVDGWIEAVAGVIREAQQATEIHSRRDPNELAIWLVTSLQGATTNAKALQDDSPLTAFVSIAFDVVLA